MDDEEVDNVPEPVDPDWTCAQDMEDSDEEIGDSQSNKGYFFFLLNNVYPEGKRFITAI